MATNRTIPIHRTRLLVRVTISVLLAAASITTVSQPSGADSVINGVNVTYPDREDLLKIEMTTARRLLLRCTWTSNRIILFIDGSTTGTVLDMPCRVSNIWVVGSPGNDHVTVDVRRFQLGGRRNGVTTQLGDGDDVGIFRTDQQCEYGLFGEAGNDQLTFDLTPVSWFFTEFLAIELDGGPGDDVIRHNGYTREPPAEQRWIDPGSYLTGGPGADRLYGPDDSMPTSFGIDASDTRVRWSPVVSSAWVEGGTSAQDVVDIQLRATETWVTFGGARTWIPGRAQWVAADTDQNDHLTVRGKSPQTQVRAYEGGTLRLRPFEPYALDRDTGTLTQEGAAAWHYTPDGWAKVQVWPFS